MNATDLFMQGYFSAALFTGQHYPDPTDPDSPAHMDDFYGIDDIPADIVEEMETDCLDFIEAAGDLIAENPERAGMDFHFTRNGHGAGFWDGDWGDAGDELSEMSKVYGSSELYSDAEGIYLM